MAEVGRNHVLRQDLTNRLPELACGYLAFTFVEEHDNLLRLVIDHTSIWDELERVDDDMLDLAQLDTIARVLDESVLPPLEHDLAALVARDDVAGPIDDFRIGRVQRILCKRRSRLLGIVVVACHHHRTPDMDFSDTVFVM